MGPSRAGPAKDTPFDAIVVGSGFGGALAARAMVDAGMRVLMLERGDWVRRGPENRDLSLAWKDRPAFSRATPYHVAGESRQRIGAFHCVGGASVYYGGVTLRFREEDFQGCPEVTGSVRWPFGYDELRPYYHRAERLLGVSGEGGVDPTEPPRDEPLPPPGLDLSPTSRALRDAARIRGLRPFRLPLALNDHGSRPGPACTACGTCDGFACALSAKNDLATVVIPDLVARGMALRTGTVAVRIETDGGRVTAVEAVDREDGRRLRFRAERLVVAAGALGTPHLLLASGLERMNPAGDLVGRFLMRHCNAIVAGPAPPHLGDPDDFRKQIGIHDYYFGDGSAAEPRGKLGAVQQIRATRVGLAELALPRPLLRAVQPVVDRVLALIVLAEDQPRPENRVRIDRRHPDLFGRPRAHVYHRYTSRDRAARRVLMDRASELLRDVGVPFTVRKALTTFSHALGTVRMGVEEDLFPLTPDGRFRGLDNLWVSDGSVFPTSGAVNPSLTIAANALRVGAAVAGAPPPSPAPGSRTTGQDGQTIADLGSEPVPPAGTRVDS